jgi:hypothetical protein
MAKLKYQQYIVDTTRIPESVIKKDTQAGKSVVWLDERVVEGAFILSLTWYTRPFIGIDRVGHSHDFDEVLGFIGSDWENPTALNGEIEFWLEDEKYMLTKSCTVFIPKGVKHCPLQVHKVDRPIIHFHTGPANRYTRD